MVFLLPKTFDYFAFQSFGFKRYLGNVFQKHLAFQFVGFQRTWGTYSRNIWLSSLSVFSLPGERIPETFGFPVCRFSAYLGNVFQKHLAFQFVGFQRTWGTYSRNIWLYSLSVFSVPGERIPETPRAHYFRYLRIYYNMLA